MARDHVPEIIEALIALDADAIAAQALAEAGADLTLHAGKSASARTFRSSLIVVDDFTGDTLADFKKILIYRSARNADEVAA